MLTQSLHDWQNFYVMTGAASATIMGLMFVAVSLGANFVSGRQEANIRLFVTPNLIHLIAVLVLAAVLLIPTHTYWTLGALLLLAGVAGSLACIAILRQMQQHPQQDAIDPGHRFWHGFLPLAGYAVIGLVGVWLLTGDLIALNGIAFSMIVLLVIGIWNTWDLILWIARKRGVGPAP